MRLSLVCIVFLLACQSDSRTSNRQHADSKGPTAEKSESDAAIDAQAPDVEDDEPSKVDWILNQSCEPRAEPDACDRCEAEKCCNATARTAAPETQAYVRCTSDCLNAKKTVAECYTSCDALHPSGTEDFASFFACNVLLCGGADACGDGPRSGCDLCLTTRCLEEYLTILGTREGFLWFQCNGACADGDGTCYVQCVERYPNLEPDLLRMAECQASQCSMCPEML